VSVAEVQQYSDDDLKQMSPEQIAKAYHDGKLARIMGRRIPIEVVDDPPAEPGGS
jgi:hypothetical protein